MSLSQRARTLLTARANPPVWMTRFSKTIGIPVIVLCLVAIYGLVFGRIVLNGSDSLAARGFYVVVWPKPLIRDAIVVSDPPARFTDKFAGLVFRWLKASSLKAMLRFLEKPTPVWIAAIRKLACFLSQASKALALPSRIFPTGPF